QQMIVAKMPAADVPVEVFGLQVEREGIGQQHVQRRRNLIDRGLRPGSRGVEIGWNPGLCVLWPGFARGEPCGWDDGTGTRDFLLSCLYLLSAGLPVGETGIGHCLRNELSHHPSAGSWAGTPSRRTLHRHG